LRRMWGLTLDQQVILFVGSLSEHKGVAFLITALDQVVRAHPDAALVIAGSGPLETDLRRHTTEMRLDSRVRFAGRISYREIPAYMAAADVLVHPSLDEGLPRVVLEAMAMKLPVVASRVGGIPEVVIDGRTGLLVPAGDPDSLAHALQRVLASMQLARGWGEEARASVEATYSFEAGIALYADLLAEVARG
jgi:glycosyltransferase involved in cell wall biosynthesis